MSCKSHNASSCQYKFATFKRVPSPGSPPFSQRTHSFSSVPHMEATWFTSASLKATSISFYHAFQNDSTKQCTRCCAPSRASVALKHAGTYPGRSPRKTVNPCRRLLHAPVLIAMPGLTSAVICRYSRDSAAMKIAMLLL
jgi:hypothetical protein